MIHPANFLILGLATVSSAYSDQQPMTIEAFYAPGSPTRVIAHRGFSGAAPENTLAAIESAIELGADMVEFDVTVSADGELVVIHDPTLKRTTNGRGMVMEKTLEELQQLDAGSWFGPEFAGEVIPTLDQVLERTNGRVLLNIEIKSEAVIASISAKVARLVSETGMVDKVVVSSFSPLALEQIRTHAPDIRTASLFNRKIHRGIDPAKIVAEVGAGSFNINRRFLTKSMLHSCQKKDIPVAVYTVNRKRDMRYLIDNGIHALFTDYPDRLMEVLAEK